MEPKLTSKEGRLLAYLRQQRGAGGALGIDWVCDQLGLEGGAGALQRIVSKLRRMGFEIKGWRDRGDKKVYAYQLVQEARAEDPFVYLSSLIGKKANIVLPWKSYRVEVGWYPGRRGEMISIAIYPARRRKAASIEHYNIDRCGVVGFGWDESQLGAQPLIPVLALRTAGWSSPLQEERMLVDHIRAHIVQNFIRRALVKENKERSSPVARVS